jgi:hypothetical protein
MGAAPAGPVAAYVCDWNPLPIGQQLWLKEMEAYSEFPPLQSPESYKLSQVLEEVKQNRPVVTQATDQCEILLRPEAAEAGARSGHRRSRTGAHGGDRQARPAPGEARRQRRRATAGQREV